MTEDRFPIAAAARRRVYGEVSAAEFQLFAKRARAEGLLISEAMNAIASAYAHGDFYILTRDRSKQQSVNFYLEQHAKRI